MSDITDKDCRFIGDLALEFGIRSTVEELQLPITPDPDGDKRYESKWKKLRGMFRTRSGRIPSDKTLRKMLQAILDEHENPQR